MDRRQFLRTAGVGSVAALAGCAGGTNVTVTSLPPETVLVKVAPDGGYKFSPDTLTIEAGTTVIWKWFDGGHNVVPDGIPAESDWKGHEEWEGPGFEHQHTFTVPGDYHYICVPHENLGMVGDITVVEE
ncbi:plastocyanin/azurin family copper-binding protein [Salarchaeum sp. JOR-1]|uniref:plastocyanin/azurin family copper-binding protein n=1 Tax=Salarchaeum sp. JOR-1 TaxID=2599399 RepID=UPI0011983CBA|nr:plastocyanin/azurin family copper-binding protein [Salarchaeum sp. JOR-1]QDX41412.1 hypothetical protein FQU85_11055 [Salarchaeum sp. JOR-1]